jgi:hypothetical protein
MLTKRASEYKVWITPSLLTIVIFPDNSGFGVKCLELDLITEDDTPDKALKAIVEMIREYAEDYEERFELFSTSSNRTHHQPYIQRILECKNDWEVLEISEVKYGSLHL